MSYTSTTDTQALQKLYIAYFGRPADPLGMTYWVNDLAAGGTYANAAQSFSIDTEYTAFAAGKTNAQLINAIYQNLFSRDADVDGLNYWVTEMSPQHDGPEQLTIARVAESIAYGAQAADTIIINDKIAAAEAFTAAVDTTPEIIGYDGTAAFDSAAAWLYLVKDAASLTTAQGDVDVAVAAAVAAGTPPAPGETFTLTTGVNNFTGTSGDDLFDASLSGTNATLSSLDSLNGGLGTDTLSATVTGGTTTPTLTDIETLSLTATAAATVDLLHATGYTTVENTGTSTGTLTINNINSTTVALHQSNSDQGATFSYTTAAKAGSADTATLTLSNVTAGADVITGIETLTIASTGAANAATFAGTTATKLIITGDQNLTTNTGAVGLSTSTTNVDASAFTGVLTTTLGAVVNATVTGGAGNDSINVDAATGIVSVNAGAGNDTVTATTNWLATDIIDGGDGTADVFSSTAILLEGYADSNVTNFERLNVTTAGVASSALDLSNLGAADYVTLALGTAGAYGVTGPATALTVNVKGAALGGTITLTDTGTGIADAAILANTQTTGATDILGGRAVVSSGYETLTIKSGTSSTLTPQTVGAVTMTPDSGGSTAVNFSGGQNISVGTITAGIIDASGMTGTATFTNTGATGATKITGGANGDTLVGSATATSIDGAAGNDIITGGAANDTLIGGDGTDSMTASTGVDSLSGGAGTDTFNFATTGDFTAADVVDGGDGTDTLKVNLADITNLVATLTNVTSIEKLRIIDGVTGALDMARFGAAGPTTLVSATDANGGAVTNMLAGSTFEQLAANTGATSLVYATDTTADTLTLKLNAAASASFGTVTASSLEQININSTTSGTATLNTLVLTTTNAKGITITGDVALALSTSGASAANIATVTAADMTAGGVSMDNSYATVNATMTGSAFADTLVGGGGADTINGGDGADSLVGGSSADSLTGGYGDDTLDGGSGIDTLLGGDGNDVIWTSSGADSMDGGNGTDKLMVSPTFANISAMTTTSIETLDMNSTPTTMTAAQISGFTTVLNPAAVTISAAGTVAANATITIYNLAAAGTNTFTASTTASDVSVTGGSVADTFNFGSSLFTVADTVKGGTGTDTLNITGNTAVATGSVDNVSAVESIIFSNTSTNVTIVAKDAMNTTASSTAPMTIDATNLTAGVLAFNAATNNETDSGYIILGGGAADVIVLGDDAGSLGSTVDGGGGDDSITGTVSTIGDNLSGGTGNDTFIMAGDMTVLDIISGGIGTNDILTFTDDTLALTDLNNVTGIETITLGAAITAITLTNDTLVASGQTLTIDATGATSIAFTGTTELDGKFYITGNATTANTIVGGSGADTLVGGTAADSLVGGIGNDSIVASAGVDNITGGSGADTINLTGAGADADADRVIYTQALGADGGTTLATADTITGFVAASDTIVVLGALKTAVDVSGAGAVTDAKSSTGATGNVATLATTELLFSVTANSALTTANFGTMSAVATAINAMFDFTTSPVEPVMVLLAGSAATAHALYLYTEAGTSTGDNAVDASELVLLGVFTSDAALAATTVVFA